MTDKAKELGNMTATGFGFSEAYNGLTKREHFAGLAMAAIIQAGTAGGSTIKEASAALGISENEYKAEVHYPILIARDALIQADALLEQLSK